MAKLDDFIIGQSPAIVLVLSVVAFGLVTSIAAGNA